MRLIAQVVHTNSFPPPEGYDSWTIDAVHQATELYLAKGAAIVAEAKAAAGGDTRHLERRLLKTIRNYLIDQAKATRVGLMRNRIATMLMRHDDFVRVDGANVPTPGWAPVDSASADGELWQGDHEELYPAAWNTAAPTNVVFNKSGPPSKQTKQALLDVIDAVFAIAGSCYLPDQTLAASAT